MTELKKKLKILLRILLLLILIAVVVFKLWEAGAFIFDHTAEVSLNHVTWNGKTYSAISGAYTEGRTIAKGKNDWVINLVEEDPSHTFIVSRSFLDDSLLVSDDYAVPVSGKLTTVSWNGSYITDAFFLDALEKIDASKTTTFTYETEGIYLLTDHQQMRDLYFAYENCPVATNFKGYMGKVNGEWVITTDISRDRTNDDGSPKPYSVSCYTIPDEYGAVLSKYFD